MTRVTRVTRVKQRGKHEPQHVSDDERQSPTSGDVTQDNEVSRATPPEKPTSMDAAAGNLEAVSLRERAHNDRLNLASNPRPPDIYAFKAWLWENAMVGEADSLTLPSSLALWVSYIEFCIDEDRRAYSLRNLHRAWRQIGRAERKSNRQPPRGTRYILDRPAITEKSAAAEETRR